MQSMNCVGFESDEEPPEESLYVGPAEFSESVITEFRNEIIGEGKLALLSSRGLVSRQNGRLPPAFNEIAERGGGVEHTALLLSIKFFQKFPLRIAFREFGNRA